MSDPQKLMAEAREKAKRLGVPFDGALAPREAFDLWKSANGAVLVDVRTAPELSYVGRIPGTVEIEWNSYPSGRNPRFADQLQTAVTNKEAPLLFLCRSGVRSAAAASLAQSLGYAHAINVLEGFEGDLDAEGHRNTLGGWRKAGLPWKQS